MIAYLKDLTQKVDHKFKDLHERMFQWYNLKLFIAIVTTLMIIDNINFSSRFMKFMYCWVVIILVYSLFGKPKDNKNQKNKSRRLLKWLNKLDAVLDILNEKIFYWHDFKFVLAVIDLTATIHNMDNFTQNSSNIFVNVCLYIMVYLLFWPPKTIKSR